MNAAEQSRLLELVDSQLIRSLTAEEHQELESLLLDDPAAQQLYHDYLELGHCLNRHYETVPAPVLEPAIVADDVTESFRRDESPLRWGMGLAAAVCVVTMIAVIWFNTDTPIDPVAPAESVVNHPARFTQLDDARFLDQSLWRMGDPIQAHQEITLRSGLIKLQAARGAEVILEGPAVFEWNSPKEMVLKYGRCSVNVPEAAEKIVVQTPSSRVVDLGTSFAIDVTESGESQVQLIEGMADVYRSESESTGPERLNKGDARQYGRDEDEDSVAIPFNEKVYRSQLPDGIVTYTANETDDGIDELKQVTVQRDGQLYKYDVTELIGVELVHFSGAPSPGYLTTPLSVANGGAALIQPGERHRLLDDDFNLATGIINPWGEMTPLQSAPVLEGKPVEENSPGIGIRFREPVVNSAGPDVVLFDLHVIVHSEEGDAFHVSPLNWREGLRPATITKFDITLSSPEAQLLVPFRLVKLKEQAFSLEELEQLPVRENIEHIVRARVLAVGIDLSDLGYAEGERVDGLFLQDLTDDGSHLDPVFIGGLPDISP